MSELNQDGLMPGQPVDFETIQRIENAKRQEVQNATTEEDGATDESGVPTKPFATRKNKAQKS